MHGAVVLSSAGPVSVFGNFSHRAMNAGLQLWRHSRCLPEDRPCPTYLLRYSLLFGHMYSVTFVKGATAALHAACFG